MKADYYHREYCFNNYAACLTLERLDAIVSRLDSIFVLIKNIEGADGDPGSESDNYRKDREFD